MGGSGSGNRWQSGKTLTTEYRAVDVRRWAREGYLQPGRAFGWQWSQNGEQVAIISVRAETGCIRLIYRSREYGGEWEDLDYPVRFLSQPCNFGGHRDWFACPARGCGRRAALLYGGRIFACRQCYQLAYPSTREAAYQRAQRRADKIAERLGWTDDPDLMHGIKPKGMHWKTFERLAAEFEHWEAVHEQDFAYHPGSWANGWASTHEQFELVGPPKRWAIRWTEVCL